MKRFWPELCHPADWMLSPFALLIPEQTESGASAVVARQGSAKLERQVIAPGYHYVDSNQMAKLTSESILNYLDTCVEASFFNFMELDHPYFHTANSRLSLFADQENWATVFERSAYSDGSWSLELELWQHSSQSRHCGIKWAAPFESKEVRACLGEGSRKGRGGRTIPTSRSVVKNSGGTLRLSMKSVAGQRRRN